MLSLRVDFSCCEKANEWDKYAKEMSAKLTGMIPRKKFESFGHQFGYRYEEDSEDFDQLDLVKLNEIRAFARKICANKFLYTDKWNQEKLVSLEHRVTLQIEVF